MSAWCSQVCHREPYHGCDSSCPVFGKTFEDLAEMILHRGDERLPETYAEIDYGDRDDAEAIIGSRWDDMNYCHYTER